MTNLALLLGVTALTLAAAVPASDEAFAKKAAQGGEAEVQLGQLALTKASNQKVKDFAQKMVDDHSRMGDDLKALAAQKDIMLPSGLSEDDQALSNKLSGLSGDAFDKAYMSAMVKDHRTDIADFQKEANSVADKALHGFASRNLPTLRQHLQLAMNAATAVGAPTT